MDPLIPQNFGKYVKLAIYPNKEYYLFLFVLPLVHLLLI